MSASRAEVAARYGIVIDPDPGTLPPPELFPKKPAWIVREEDGRRILDVASWGFPHTFKGVSGKSIEKPVTNVRNYTSPFWRTAMASAERRCLVPFTAFSEYGPGPVGGKPLHWFDVPSRPIVSFAGLWRHLPGGECAYAFLTCEPNRWSRQSIRRLCRCCSTRTMRSAGWHARLTRRSGWQRRTLHS